MDKNEQEPNKDESTGSKVPPLPDLSHKLEGLTGSGGPQPRNK